MRLLLCLTALGTLLACGHYGPPVRSAEEPAQGDSRVLAPAEAAECEEEDEQADHLSSIGSFRPFSLAQSMAIS